MLTTRCSAGLAAIAIVAPCWSVLADELHVPSQYPTIAAAVAASQAGDEIILADGEYTGDGNHDITMPLHDLTLRSASGNPAACAIRMRDMSLFDAERALRFVGGAAAALVVRGIGIVDGRGAQTGGGVMVERASPVFIDCIFEGNWATGPGDSHGGAVYLSESNAVFERCVFTQNRSGWDEHARGGGVYVTNGSPTFVDCLFERNGVDAVDDHPGYGGGLYVAGVANVMLLRTRFVDNQALGPLFWSDAEVYGGGLYVSSGTVTAIGCEFAGNSASSVLANGGAISMRSGQVHLLNCRLIENSVTGVEYALGGAIHAAGAGEMLLTNCLVAGNFVEPKGSLCFPAGSIGGFGGAAFISGSARLSVRNSTVVNSSAGAASCGGECFYLTDAKRAGSHVLEITNSIIWGSGEQPIEIYGVGATVDASFCILKGEWPGEQILDVDPMFVDPAAGDYRLLPGSPAADAGANDLVPPDTFDLDGDGDTTEPLPLDLAFNPRFTDDPAAPDTGRGTAPIVDMGAYETVVDGCYADCDGSGDLDFFDFLCFQNAFAAREPYADCDGSGQHDFFDFLCFQNAFAAGCR